MAKLSSVDVFRPEWRWHNRSYQACVEARTMQHQTLETRQGWLRDLRDGPILNALQHPFKEL